MHIDGRRRCVHLFRMQDPSIPRIYTQAYVKESPMSSKGINKIHVMTMDENPYDYLFCTIAITVMPILQMSAGNEYFLITQEC